MSMRFYAALALCCLLVATWAAGCGNDSKAGCNPDACAPVKCPDGDRRACIDGACVTDLKQICAGQT